MSFTKTRLLDSQHLTFLVNLEFHFTWKPHAGANDQIDQVCRHLLNDFWVVLVRMILRFESPDSESLAARWDAGASNEEAFLRFKLCCQFALPDQRDQLYLIQMSSQSQMFVKPDAIRSRRCWRLRIFVSFVCHWHMEFTQSSLAP